MGITVNELCTVDAAAAAQVFGDTGLCRDWPTKKNPSVAGAGSAIVAPCQLPSTEGFLPTTRTNGAGAIRPQPSTPSSSVPHAAYFLWQAMQSALPAVDILTSLDSSAVPETLLCTS